MRDHYGNIPTYGHNAPRGKTRPFAYNVIVLACATALLWTSCRPAGTPSGTAPRPSSPPETRSATNEPRDWVYFVSRENTGGRPAELVLSTAAGKRTAPVALDSELISYLADGVYGRHWELGVSLNDSNRVLLQFNLPSDIPANALQKAEISLDMRLSGLPPKAPFDIAIHRVTSPWDETNTTWLNQPAFDSAPAASVTVEPRSGNLSVDVTEVAQAWLTGTPNHGVILKTAFPLGTPPISTMTATSPSTPAPPPEPAPVIPSPPTMTTTSSTGVFPDAVPAYARLAPRKITSSPLAVPPLETAFEPLPWPHQAPGATPSDIETLNGAVWVINNFPLYQCGDTNAYLHTGLDLVLDNGAAIYAIKDGYVKSTKHSTIIIADAQGLDPCFGWAYTHLGDFQVAEGDFVHRGKRIGRIEFSGLAHLHLQKVYSQAPYWGEWQYVVMPNDHFIYPDEDPPVIQAPFYLFKNETDDLFKPDASGEVVVSGDVDIVVAMREQGLYAHSRESGFGDRLAVAQIQYEIRSADTGARHRFGSFDFTRMAIKESVTNTRFNTEITKIVYKHPLLFETDRKTGDRNLSYYVITNCPSDEPPRELSPDFYSLAWRTASRDASGAPRFPSGPYEIAVTARDCARHAATAAMRVTVRNKDQ